MATAENKEVELTLSGQDVRLTIALFCRSSPMPCAPCAQRRQPRSKTSAQRQQTGKSAVGQLTLSA
ncbi:MAG: hypothetical protein WKG07_29145 [Hymenobacter sp.]